MNRRHLLLAAAALFLVQVGAAQPGSWKQIGQKGAWQETILAASCNNILYSIDKTGSLYKTNLSNWQQQKIGTADFSASVLLFVSSNNIVFTVEKDGTLYRTNPATGVTVQVGEAGEMALVVAGTMIGNDIYTTDILGDLFRTSGNTGFADKVLEDDFYNTVFLFSDEKNWNWSGVRWLYSIESDGSLIEINPVDGAWEKIGITGDLVNTIAGTVFNGRLYTVNDGGELLETIPDKGVSTRLGNADFTGTRFLFAGRDKIYSIETDGTLYGINLR